MTAILSLIASFIYLLGFFGIDFVQSFTTREEDDHDDDNRQFINNQGDGKISPRGAECPAPKIPPTPLPEEDEEIIRSIVQGTTPSYSLESKLGDCKRAASIRREALQRMMGKSVEGLPLEGFDYESILGQCCEMPIGYVQIPVGIAGPLLLDGVEYSVPLATNEGCLVASTNRFRELFNLICLQERGGLEVICYDRE